MDKQITTEKPPVASGRMLRKSTRFSFDAKTTTEERLRILCALSQNS